MKWLFNSIDPKSPDFHRNFFYSLEAMGNPLKMQKERQDFRALIASKKTGPPQATEWRTVEELENDGIVGIYEDDTTHPAPG